MAIQDLFKLISRIFLLLVLLGGGMLGIWYLSPRPVGSKHLGGPGLRDSRTQRARFRSVRNFRNRLHLRRFTPG